MPKSATKKSVSKAKPAAKAAAKPASAPAAKLAQPLSKVAAPKAVVAKAAKKPLVKADSKSQAKIPAKKSDVVAEKVTPLAKASAANTTTAKAVTALKPSTPAKSTPASKTIVAEVKSKAAPSQESAKVKASNAKASDFGALAVVTKGKAPKAVVEADASGTPAPVKPAKQLLSKAALKKLEAKIRSEADVMKRWQSVFDQYAKVKPTPYSMSGTFEPSQAIEHTVLGWGLILECRENRIQVLFKDGIRTLIMNYRP